MGKKQKVEKEIITVRMRTVIKKIKQLIDDTAIHADWLNNNNLKKTLASNLMMLLYHNDYPPQWSQEIFEKVLDQVENFRTYN